ncbi:hypothetical protein PtB15_17B435 [Puccinia triticina]|nr:hypothetical protein PtB15_17B435 [Puccinia triticina]
MQPQQPITQHARFKSSPAKAVSDYGHPPSSSPVKNFNRPHQQRSGAPSLISQIPDRHAASPIPPSPAGFPANSGLYAEHDILMPPRPAFYGSRMPVRSISSEQSPSRQSYAGPRISATLNRASTGAPAGLYNNPRASSSNASIRSVPVPASAKPVRDEDEDEDEVPLSKLKKKSCSSLRDPLRTISPAQTLIRTRHQLHASVIHPFSSASSASASVFSSSGASTDDRRASVVSARSGGDKAARHLSHTASSSTALKSQQTGNGNLAGHPRGNSPASSSSGGSESGSGSWNFPATPRDSFLPVPTHIHPHPHPAFALLAGPGYLMPGPPGSSASTQPADGQTFGTGGEGAAAVGGPGGGRPPPVGPDASPENPAGYWTASPAPPAPASSVDDLPTPVGVDPYLYAGLDTAQKIALHQRSQLILQMMAVQAQTAAQMHALAAANGPAHSLVSSAHGHRASASIVSVGPVPQPRIAPSSLHHQRAATGDFDAGGNADGRVQVNGVIRCFSIVKRGLVSQHTVQTSYKRGLDKPSQGGAVFQLR